MTVGCNIWMICLKLNWLFYNPSLILQLFEFVWTLRSFLLIDATDRSTISSDQKRLFFAVSVYPLSFFANPPYDENWSYYFLGEMLTKLSLDNTMLVYKFLQELQYSLLYSLSWKLRYILNPDRLIWVSNVHTFDFILLFLDIPTV